jgi:hypothetical protein
MTDATGLVPVTRFALLAAGVRWPGVDLDGLELLPDGRVELQRLPQVSPPSLTAPGMPAVSGLGFGCELELSVEELIAAGGCVGGSSARQPNS